MIKQRILILVLFCFFAGSWAMAQRGQVKGFTSTMTEETKASLNLSADQLVQLNALQAQTAKAREAARQEGGDRTTAMLELKAADEARLEEILTSEQMLRLRKISMDANEKGNVALEQEERTRVRPEQKEDSGVVLEQEERTRVRPEQKDRERVRPEEELTRERVRPEQEERTRERVRSEKTGRSRDISAEDRESMKAEIDSYRKKNIEPATLAQRQKLDAAMSAEDRARLATLRSELATGGELRNAQQNKEVSAMVSKYDVEITRLLKEMAPMEAQWKADQNIIRAKYMGQENDRVRRPEGEREYRSEDTGNPDMDDKVRFLLQNANERRN
jgi:translation initiation factor 4G